MVSADADAAAVMLPPCIPAPTIRSSIHSSWRGKMDRHPQGLEEGYEQGDLYFLHLFLVSFFIYGNMMPEGIRHGDLSARWTF